MVILQVLGDALIGRAPPKPTFIKGCDFEADGGRGLPVFTQKREDAKKFDDAAQALDYWKTQSQTVPLRPDGKPNRPLTAFNVTILRDDAEAL